MDVITEAVSFLFNKNSNSKPKGDAAAAPTTSNSGTTAAKSNSIADDVNARNTAVRDAEMAQWVQEKEQEYVNDPLVRIIIVGCGNRGKVYSTYALEHPTRAKVVAIADPLKFRREFIATQHQLQPEFIFEHWEDIANRDKMADAVVISTPDRLHAEPAIAFANKGYHILVEKPMAVSEDDCVRMTKAVKDNNVIMAVGHVMRYTPYTQKIKQLVDSGAIGDVVCIQHLEPVGWFHQAHSYVRGNWRREDESSFMLMAKSCHDIDWIKYIMNRECKRVSSFGSLIHFRPEKKPADAAGASRCLDCPIQNSCPYSATTIYLKPARMGFKGWPLHVICTNSEPSEEAVTDALRNGPYGRCVYECDNDVVDNQVVNLEFAGGYTASFTMIAFSQDVCVRKTRIFGTHGQLECNGSQIVYYNFRGDGDASVIYPDPQPPSRMTGHDSGDYYLMRSFVHSVAQNDPAKILSGPSETLESHLIVFKAEQARKQGAVLNVDF